MPAWNTTVKQWVREGKLVVIGIAQEQHSDRNRLFTQWHQIDWPVLYDPINVMQVRGVPIEVAIDEFGIVRGTKLKPETLKAEFLDKSFETDTRTPEKPVKPIRPDLDLLRQSAQQSSSADAWRWLGDALVLWTGQSGIEEAIKAYTQAINIKPDDGDAHFRLGVCYRMRYDSPQQMPSDFQNAVDHWTKARQIEPNQYIWRRRIEQYGPRLTKPYPFYDWVETAAAEIRARGEKPIELKVLPTGSEIAAPDTTFDIANHDVAPPDPQGRIHRDAEGLVLAEVTVVPPQVKPEETARIHITLRPNTGQKAHWNNEADPLKLWIDSPDGWQVRPQLLIAPQGEQPETSEPRRLEFEVRAPAGASGTAELAAYALYYACEDVNGTCQFLRLDIPVKVTVKQ